MNQNLAQRYEQVAAHTQAGRLAEAEKLLREIVQHHPREAEAYFQWALLACAAQNFSMVQKLAENAASIQPQGLYLTRVAEVLADRGQYEQAAQLCAAELRNAPPGDVRTWVNRAVYLNKLHQSAESLRVLAQAKALVEQGAPAPKEAGYMIAFNRGVAQMNAGDLTGARASYEEAMREAPSDGLCRRSLTEVMTFTNKDAALVAEFKTLAEKKPDADICFALGKAHNDLKDFDAAFEWYQRGNNVLLQNINIKQLSSVRTELLEATQRVFTADFFARYAGSGALSDMPIFIVGLPRSGTTLLEQILAGHSKIKGIGEAPYLLNLAGNFPAQLGTKEAYPTCLQSASKEKLSAIAKGYLKLLESQSEGKSHVVDKMPYNFWYLGVIALLFPQAKILHITRDPMDNAVSNYFAKFEAGGEWARSLESYAAYYHDYCTMMAHWQKVLPLPIYTLSYEALANDIEGEAKKAITYLGLAWEEGCLNFQRGQHVQTASAFQVRQGVYTSSIGRWRHYEKHLGGLKKALAKA